MSRGERYTPVSMDWLLLALGAVMFMYLFSRRQRMGSGGAGELTVIPPGVAPALDYDPVTYPDKPTF